MKIKTVPIICPNCKTKNCINIPFKISPQKIPVKWFNCSFCFTINKKEKWL